MFLRTKKLALAAMMLAFAGSAGAQQLIPHNGDLPSGTFFPEALSHRVGAALPTDDYLRVAVRNAEFERQAAELAQARAVSPRVRSFAARMAADGARATALLQAAASNGDGATAPAPSPEPNAVEQAMLDRLRGLNGAAFDRSYLGGQRQEQLVMLELHTNYRYNGASRPVRTAAARQIPLVEQHLSLLNSLRGVG